MLREKFLLYSGIILILVGIIGVVAAGFAFYNFPGYIDEFEYEVGQCFFLANQITDDASIAVKIETIRDSIFSHIGLLRLFIYSSLDLMSVLSFLFILIGFSILWIRNRI